MFLVQSIMFGTGVLSLPERLSSLGYSQALMPILFGVIASISLWPMIWICSKYHAKNLFEINEEILGKSLGKCINAFIVIQLILLATAKVSNYVQLIQSTALQEQTTSIPLILVLLLVLYIVNGGIKNVARFCIMAFFITIPMVYFLKWSINKGDISHVFPLFNHSWNDFFVAFDQGFNTVFGYEVILIFFPYIINKQKAFKHALIGIWISVSLFFLTTLVSVMYFSEWQLSNVQYSVLHLFKAGGFSFVERIDIFGITLWVFLVLSSVSGYIWASMKGVNSIISKRKSSHVYIIATTIFVILTLPLSHENLERAFIVSYRIGYGLLLWPIILIALHFIKKSRWNHE
ncbi:GerAB/ArcD/ProY family transporter [Psychrobacillus sp. FSL K6-4046]|uniref:GerAB/ArcD/ProY family transporter n=1 Tax=Psychrobacillus sp. FSL K6-4046 TaxID=2921550 RepID=UPI00315B37F5